MSDKSLKKDFIDFFYGKTGIHLRELSVNLELSED